MNCKMFREHDLVETRLDRLVGVCGRALGEVEIIGEPKNHFWLCYLEDRVPDVQADINRLRKFANQHAPHVANEIRGRASDIQNRLDVVKALVIQVRKSGKY